MSREETSPSPFEHHERKRVRYDPTVNLGHVLTFVGYIVAMGVGWGAMDKRLTVLEEARVYQQQRDASQDAAVNEKLSAIKEGVKEIRDAVEKLDRKVRP